MNKNILLALAAIAAALSSYAQNLTAATDNPMIGEKFYGHECQLTGVSKGNSGNAQVWDFTALKPVYDYDDSTVYQSCSSTPYCDSVGAADLATHMSDGWGYKYYKTTGSSFYEFRDVRPNESWYFSQPNIIMHYPMGYDTVVSDSFYRWQPYFGFWVSGRQTFIGDGTGTLKMPYYTYDSVLRVHITRHENIHNTVPGVTTIEEYRWYKPGFHTPILVITYNNVPTTGMPTHVSFYTRSYITGAVAGIENSVAEMIVSPNPAGADVRMALSIKSSCAVHASLIDMLGREVMAQDLTLIPGKANVTFDVAALPAGTYMARIQTAEGRLQEKVAVAH